MTIKDQNDETPSCIKECSNRQSQGTVVNLLHEKLEAENAFDDSSDINESEHLDKFFDFLHKTSNSTVLPRQCFKNFWNFRLLKAAMAN